MIDTIKAVLENTQNRTPMVHSITNNVTINDCANIILAAGGTAIMAQDEREVEEITSHAQALVINMGAVRAQEAMLRAAKIAKRNGRPVVLDPVAAGASTLRREMCSRLLSENLVSVIRGNASEVRALAAGAEQETGVEASALDSVTEDNLQESAAWLRSFSRRTGAVVMLTGAMDVITNGTRTAVVRGGSAYPAADHRRRLYAHLTDRRVLRCESRYIVRSRSHGIGGDEALRRNSRGACA